MKKLFFLIPFIFLGIKPYQQNVLQNVPEKKEEPLIDSLDFAKETLLTDLEELKKLEEKKKSLESKLNQIKKRKKASENKEEVIQKIINFKNRGI